MPEKKMLEIQKDRMKKWGGACSQRPEAICSPNKQKNPKQNHHTSDWLEACKTSSQMSASVKDVA